MAGVFISYRRSDSAGHTGRLADDLSEGLEEQQLFRDIEAIEAGEDFVEALNRAVGACSVMLVVIGPTWAKAETADGKRRLHQEGDFVRMEIETALARQVRVIPVLVNDAQMPQPEDLPESMQPLLRRNAYMVSDRRWQYDINQLLDILEKIPGIASRKQDGAAQPAAAQLPSSQSGMRTWMKLALVSGATLVVIVALSLMFGGEPAETSAQTVSAAALPVSPAPEDGSAQKDFVGFWRSEDNLFYDVAQDGDGLTVVSGDALDPAKPVDATATDGPPAKAGVELVGKASVTGRTLDVMLTDSFSNATETLSLTLSGDGRTLEGTMAEAGQPPIRVVLRRQ